MYNTKFNILDFGKIRPPKISAHEVINSLFMDVEKYEQLGYHRYWLSEHYSPEFAWFSPEMLMPFLLGYSSKIKIGWAGVLLNLHNPLFVSSNMRLLSAIYPNRVDLGIARATAVQEYKDYMLIKDMDWKEKVDLLNEFMRGSWVYPSTGEKLFVPPHATDIPELWYLGNSSKAFDLCLNNNFNLAISFIHPGSNFLENVDTLKIYKELYFQRFNSLPKTSLLIGLGVVENGRQKKVLEKFYTIPGFNNVFGSINVIHEKLLNLKDQFDNDEFCIYLPFCDRNRRLEQFELISSIFNKP